MSAQGLSCDPAELIRLEAALATNPNELGVGIIDLVSGFVRILSYDETDTFSKTNPSMQVMAGHEAAAAMAGVNHKDARGFVIAVQQGALHLMNRSHLNRPDAQANVMEMTPTTYSALTDALRVAGAQNLVVH